MFSVKRLLVKGVSPDATNEDGLTALHQVNYCCNINFKVKVIEIIKIYTYLCIRLYYEFKKKLLLQKTNTTCFYFYNFFKSVKIKQLTISSVSIIFWNSQYLYVLSKLKSIKSLIFCMF